MNTKIKNLLKYSLILGAGLLLGWVLFGTNHSDEHRHEYVDNKSVSTSNTWTCSMHPQIRQSEPGKCPICGMELIPVSLTDTDSDDPLVLKMSNHAVELANIQTTRVGYGTEKKVLLLNGKVQEDERQIHSQTAHIGGRIEQLYINFTGEQVLKGQKLAAIYSPQLITAQEELLEAKKFQVTSPALYDAARKKLKHWKFSETQIQNIEESGTVQHELNIRSDYSGIVTQKMVNLGEHVEAGKVFYEIVDLSKVWVTFDAYEPDLRWVKEGDPIQFTVSSLPGKAFNARITFIDPVIDPQTRVARLRTEVSNTEKLLKPGMFVKGTLTTAATVNEQALTVPKSAVMWTGTRSIVYVKETDADFPAFRMKEVTLGPTLTDSYVVESGLKPGEEIVINGTFTVDAAAQLQGKRSMMNPENPEKGEVNERFKAQLSDFFQVYLPLKDALVDSDPQKASQAATKAFGKLKEVDMKMLKGEIHTQWMGYLSSLEKGLQTIQQTEDLKTQRKAFAVVSENLYRSMKDFDLHGIHAFYQYCPMAIDDQGAFWLSQTEEIRNPYFGETMMKCGETREALR